MHVARSRHRYLPCKEAHAGTHAAAGEEALRRGQRAREEVTEST